MNSCTIATPQQTLPFKRADISDKPWVDRILRLEDSRSSAWCFANMFFWVDTFRPTICAMGDRLLSWFDQAGGSFYGYPIGAGDLKSAVLALEQDALARGVPFVLRGLTERSREELEAAFPDEFDYSQDPNFFDYMYEIEKLATLAGKKLHAKRNHINRFLENNPNWSFEPITSKNLLECLAMANEWARQREEDDLDALYRAATYFEALELEGGLLRVDGRVIAFTIGEPLNSDTYIVHFEKAFADIQGAYPMINREFARHIQATRPDIRYVNREEDLGIESLQRAKRSYYPVFMVEKYHATRRTS